MALRFAHLPPKAVMKLVDEKGNLTRFASRKGLPSRDLSRNMREILSLKLPLVRSP